MTEMNCDICHRWLHAYLDNELDTAMATLVAGHLESCIDCKRRYEGMKTLVDGVKEHVQRFEAPASIAENVLSVIAAQNAAKTGIWQTILNKSRNWFAPAFSAAALATAVLLYIAVPENTNSWVDEAVSEHVRSLMAEHLNDVASSDRHTVKPWFIGKLDFSPPVYDFTPQGYPLLGGRLDYLQHQNTAALTYRHNKHIINAFILPAAEPNASLQSRSERGYNIIYWRQDHMRFIMVSDLNMTELMTLGQLMQKGM